jgi:diadenylate cyclase
MGLLTSLFNRPRVTAWDVVDILLVSLLIYEALKLIRGTRAMQMAIGLVVVILLLYLSQAFPLRTMGWLIRNVLAYLAFAAIVLFQQDIRRALSNVGRAPFFRYLSRSERTTETIEEIITASSMLAKARVGAIIVVERAIGLRNYVESGIPIDAGVSYDLLTTIFQPSTPLHDGAVIIAEDRIAAAACFLPLAVSSKLDRELGTRHRAAIGLTEESDAIAIVVSEERGEVSMAQDGKLTRRLTPDDLRERLGRALLQRRRRAPEPATSVELDT